MKMTKTEAAEVIARRANINCQENGTEPTLRQMCELISEYQHPHYAGRYIADAAAIANPRTALKHARKMRTYEVMA